METFTTNQYPNFDKELRLTQRNLDMAASTHRQADLLARSNQVDRACLLAAAAPHIEAWLSAVPVEVLGFLLPDVAARG